MEKKSLVWPLSAAITWSNRLLFDLICFIHQWVGIWDNFYSISSEICFSNNILLQSDSKIWFFSLPAARLLSVFSRNRFGPTRGFKFVFDAKILWNSEDFMVTLGANNLNFPTMLSSFYENNLKTSWISPHLPKRACFRSHFVLQ